MKKLFILLICTVLFIVLPVSTLASTESVKYVTDEVGVLTPSEVNTLEERLEKLSKKFESHFVIAVLSDIEGYYSAESYAEHYYEKMGYGWGESDSGVLLLISLKNNSYGSREYAIYAKGNAYDDIGESGLDNIEEDVLEYLRKSDYYEAFLAFADSCEDELTFDIVTNLIIAVVIGAIISFVILASMKKKLKSVSPQKAANNYVREGSFTLTKDLDLYLYRNVTRTRRQSNNSSSRGSISGGGGSRSGSRGGRF